MEAIKSTPPVTSENSGAVSRYLVGYESFKRAATKCPPYYSRQRDRFLRELVYSNGFIASAAYNVNTYLGTIPFRIVASDPSVGSHVKLATEYQNTFNIAWSRAKKGFTKDLTGQNNGAFLEVLDAPEFADTPPNEPRIGFGGLRHLDSQLVTRKSSDEYPDHPYTYKHPNGTTYMMHATRIISLVEDQSAEARHNGVGRCGVDRAIEVAQKLASISKTEGQMFGDDAPDLIFELKSSGAAAGFVDSVRDKWQEKFSNTSGDDAKIMTVQLGDKDDEFNIHNVRKFPEGFDLVEQTLVAMKHIATAFRVDIRKVWPIDNAGLGGKSDSEVTDAATKSQLGQSFADDFVAEFNYIVLPSSLQIVADGIDDAQDEQRARIELTEAQAARARIDNGTTDVRAERITLRESGRMPQSEFERQELADGRLPDGTPVTDLFYSPEYDELLPFDDAVTNVSANDSAEIVPQLREAIANLKRLRVTLTDGQRTRKRQTVYAQAALETLLAAYLDAGGAVDDEVIEE